MNVFKDITQRSEVIKHMNSLRTLLYIDGKLNQFLRPQSHPPDLSSAPFLHWDWKPGIWHANTP